MTKENAITWLDTENFDQWILYRGEDEKVTDYNSRECDAEFAKTKLATTLELQAPGQYLLKGYQGHSRQGAASCFRFEIQKVSTTTQPQKNVDFNELMRKAEEIATEKIEAKMFRESVLKRLDKLESDFKELSKAVYEVNDDDEENDGPAIERLGKLAETIPAFQEGFAAFTNMFSKS